MTENDFDSLSDDELLEMAADVLRPVTPQRREVAIAALAFRDVDGELARLIEDTRLAGPGRLRGSSTSFQVVLQAGPSRLVVDVERSSEEQTQIVLLVAAGPRPSWTRLRLATGAVLGSESADWPLLFSPVRSTATIRVEVGFDDGQTVGFTSPWIGL